MAVCQLIRLHIDDFSVFMFTPITISVYAWSVHSLRTYIAPGLDLDLLCIYMKNSLTVVRQFQMNTKKIILMTLNNIFVDMIYFLYSMIFSVTLMLFRPGCVSINFILMYISNQLRC